MVEKRFGENRVKTKKMRGTSRRKVITGQVLERRKEYQKKSFERHRGL